MVDSVYCVAVPDVKKFSVGLRSLGMPGHLTESSRKQLHGAGKSLEGSVVRETCGSFKSTVVVHVHRRDHILHGPTWGLPLQRRSYPDKKVWKVWAEC